jgi:elongator complex protein 3
MMPGLYKSNLEKDIESFAQLYSDPYLKPDELKFYPTSVIPNTELYQLYKKGEYKPLTDEEIKYIIKEVKTKIIPPYTRIKRLIRDIPSTEIVA